jgi:4-amino-4-deoxy-L-arabinose transferase-like glycosyltransferase
MKQTLSVIGLLVVFIILAVSSMLQKSGTCDEIAHHIPVGVVILTRGDLKMDTSQPPLARYIMALPIVLFLNPQLPQDPAAWRVEDRSSFGRDFFFKYNHNPKKILFAGRLSILLVGILCGLIIFVWSKSLFGKKTAFFALFLYVFSPDIIAHTQLATTDMVATLCILLSVYTLWRYFNVRNSFNLGLAGISLGLAQLSKYSALILYPIFILLFIFVFSKVKKQKGENLILQVLGIFVISLMVMWAGYGFRLEPLLKNTMRADEKIELINAQAAKLPSWNESSKNKLDNFLLNSPIPLGEHLLGVLGVLRHGELGHRTYFLGTWSDKGNILYFIVAFLIKTPIPVILLLALGLVVLVRGKGVCEKYFLLLFPSLYFISALFSGLQIGVRHLLPIYPFFFIVAARSMYLTRYKIFLFILSVICIWYAVSSFMIWPNYLSYFNEFVGGPDNGYKYLRDSNIDWGQDLPALAKYLDKNKVSVVTLEYFGQDEPSVYGIKAKKFKESEFLDPGAKVYAISAQYLEYVHWTKNHAPNAKIGNSIFIYDFRNKSDVQK